MIHRQESIYAVEGASSRLSGVMNSLFEKTSKAVIEVLGNLTDNGKHRSSGWYAIFRCFGIQNMWLQVNLKLEGL